MTHRRDFCTNFCSAWTIVGFGLELVRQAPEGRRDQKFTFFSSTMITSLSRM